EVKRALELVAPMQRKEAINLIGAGDSAFGSEAALSSFLAALDTDAKLAPLGGLPTATRQCTDPDARQKRQMHEIDRHTQWLLSQSANVRKAFMSKLDSSSIETHEQTKAPYIEHLRKQVLGRFDAPFLPPN